MVKKMQRPANKSAGRTIGGRSAKSSQPAKTTGAKAKKPAKSMVNKVLTKISNKTKLVKAKLTKPDAAKSKTFAGMRAKKSAATSPATTTARGTTMGRGATATRGATTTRTIGSASNARGTTGRKAAASASKTTTRAVRTTARNTITTSSNPTAATGGKSRVTGKAGGRARIARSTKNVVDSVPSLVGTRGITQTNAIAKA